MREATSPKHMTATGDVAVGPAVIHGLILTPAAAVATAVLREGGVSGAIRVSLQAAANGPSLVVDAGSMPIRDPHVTLAGVGVNFTALL
jgi:hypothetical protein